MKSMIIIIFIIFFIFGCSNENNDTFTLVCDIKIITYTGDPQVYNKEESNETRTFKFENKKLTNYNCSTWNEEKIICSRRNGSTTENNYFDEMFVLDRVAGDIGSDSLQSIKSLNKKKEIIIKKTFNGKCEKSKGNKF
jgi:hypothetical protein